MTHSLRISLLMVLLAFSAYAVAQDEVAEGQKLFDTQCASCHTVKPGANGFGPSLAGVVGTSSIIGFALH